MNPNLRNFLKGSIYFVVFTALVAAMIYGLQNFLNVDFAGMGEYLLYGLGGFMIVVMGVLFTGLIVRVAWTSIMNRTDTIVRCCPDNNQDGVHLICSHYNPGGESEGFDSYFHYYINHQGKLYLSRRVKEDGNDLSKSILHLAEQTRLQLDPDLKSSVRIGSYNSEDTKGQDITIKINQGELRFRGYEGLIDYGFKVCFHVGNQKRWSVRI